MLNRSAGSVKSLLVLSVHVLYNVSVPTEGNPGIYFIQEIGRDSTKRVVQLEIC